MKARNPVQHEYTEAKKAVTRLCHEIERATLDLPASVGDNWAAVNDVKHLEAELREIADRLAGRGEYAPENIVRHHD